MLASGKKGAVHYVCITNTAAIVTYLQTSVSKHTLASPCKWPNATLIIFV